VASKRTKVTPLTWPDYWIPGQLLDVKKFEGGIYRFTLLGEKYDADAANGITLASAERAMKFLAWWYAPASVREASGVPA